MRIRIILISVFLFFSYLAPGQKLEEYEIHLYSIDTSLTSGHLANRSDNSYNEDGKFVNYTIKNLLSNPEDIKYISNRKLLFKFKHTTCDSLQTIISDTLTTGEKCTIEIKLRTFIESKHAIIKNKEGDFKRIDGLFPFGGEYGIPDYEIEKLSIQINGMDVTIPKSAYSNLYRPDICKNNSKRNIEAYTSLNSQFIYIYFYGGNAAGTYFVKLIFDKEKFLTKIIADYNTLSSHASFRDDFIGY